MDRYSTPSGRQTPYGQSAKVSSRRTTTAIPGLHRSPPLTTSLNSNFPPQYHPNGPVAGTALSKDAGSRLKIRSNPGVEPGSRIKSPLVPRSHTPISSSSGRTSGHTRQKSSTGGGAIAAVASAAKRLHRAITPSDSGGSWTERVALSDEVGGESDGRSSALDEPITNLKDTEAVLVTVRVRPPNQVELAREPAAIWDTPAYDQHLIKLARGREGARDEKEWIFDRILGEDSDNERAYQTSARAHVKSAMEGYNSVLFAYGQTASGKTHTLSGTPSEPGIIPLSISDLFSGIRSSPDREFLLRASYLELYNETILDLLSPGQGKELSLSEGKKKGEIIINGLTECAVRTEEEVKRLLRIGEERRKVGGTDWNQRSSRSHCVFRIVIESRAARPMVSDDGTRTPGGALKSAGDKMTRISTLSIIDLAGSEKHTSSKERNAEGRHINQSRDRLLTLKLVISKLADVASKRHVSHIPYRDSKLTRMLQPSLSGDALISVICTISPSALNVAESLSTLAFAQGLKRVMLKAQKKELVDPQALIQQYQNEIAELRALLREKEELGVDATPGMGLPVARGDRSKNEAMEKRLNELRSLILTSTNVSSVPNTTNAETIARPLSPTKLKYPKLDFDKSTTELQEDLHSAQIRIADQEDEIARLGWELELRPRDVDTRVTELQEEVAGLKLIAADYERHLREPTRKVREDVEREWLVKVQKLESQLESKKIWANRLDENFRAVTAENKDLQVRCAEAESKVLQIMEWINAALTDAPSISPSGSSSDPLETDSNESHFNLPTLVVSQDYQEYTTDSEPYHTAQSRAMMGGHHDGLGEGNTGGDFGPTMPVGLKRQSTITLTNSKMTRAQLSHMDLASFNDKFGSLTSRGEGGGFGSMKRSTGGLGGAGGEFDWAKETAADGDEEVF